MPQYSYSDMVTQTIHVGDCELLERWLDSKVLANPLSMWRTWVNRTLVEGLSASATFPNPYAAVMPYMPVPGSTECINGWRGLSPLALNPNFGTAPGYNPAIHGPVEWTHWGDLVNIYGTDETGFARSPWDNVGVQYGLQVLQAGSITPEQFLDLNANVGSWKASNDDRARGLAERALVALEREPVEPVADLRRQERVRAADLGDAVGVLDDPDRLALAVAADPRVVAGDPRRLGGEARLRPPLVGLVEAAPAALRQQHEQQHEPGEDEDAFEPRQQVPARADDARPALDVGRHPDLVALGLEQHRLEPLRPAELLDVLGQRRAPALAARRSALAPAGDEELRLERGEGEEGDPGRDRVVQRRHEEPGEHQRDRRDP